MCITSQSWVGCPLELSSRACMSVFGCVGLFRGGMNPPPLSVIAQPRVLLKHTFICDAHEEYSCDKPALTLEPPFYVFIEVVCVCVFHVVCMGVGVGVGGFPFIWGETTDLGSSRCEGGLRICRSTGCNERASRHSHRYCAPALPNSCGGRCGISAAAAAGAG